MQFGICDLSVIPVRAEPSDKSEMVTQLIFGEYFEILEQNKQWLKIQINWDNYIGWIDNKQLQTITHQAFSQLIGQPLTLVSELIAFAKPGSHKFSFPIPLGSTLPFFKDDACTINEESFKIKGKHIQPDAKHFTEKKVEEYALQFLDSPYLWGGRTPMGVDCSGFTQIIYKLMGIRIKRDAYQQAEEGIMISFIDEARTGDLAFFENDEGRITHTGIILPGKKIIHASGRVRINAIDHYGIFNEQLKTYTHRLRVIKRIL